MRFFRKKPEPEWRQLLRQDCAREGKHLNSGVHNFIWWHSYSALLFYRLSAHYERRGRYYWNTLFSRLNNVLNACFIDGAAEIGPGLKLPHPSGFVIGAHARIGKNATIYHNVTIGSRGERALDEEVIIGDNVIIYAGAVILGGVTIGDNCEIGANAVVTRDIPPNSVAVGAPARVVGGPSG